MNKLSLRYKILALTLSLAFIFQSLESINNHTYKSIGVNVHSEWGCLVTTPTHLSYFCHEFHKY